MNRDSLFKQIINNIVLKEKIFNHVREIFLRVQLFNDNVECDYYLIGDQTFESMSLKPNVVRGIHDYGYAKTRPIQRRAIPPMLADHNVVVYAYHTVQKITTYVIPILDKVDTSINECQALVICPMREMSLPIANIFKTMGRFISGLKAIGISGGTPIQQDIENLAEKKHIVCSTPGRIADLHLKNFIDLSHVKYVVLDSIDQMIDRGFEDIIADTLKRLPSNIILWIYCEKYDKIEEYIKKYNIPNSVVVKALKYL